MASSLTPWEPFAELADMRSRFDRMLSELSEEPATGVDARRRRHPQQRRPRCPRRCPRCQAGRDRDR